MKNYEVKKQKQLQLFEKGDLMNQPAKRINIVSLKLVKESSVLYKERRITSPDNAYKLLKEFLADSDRERFVVVCLDTKNQPTAINICHVGSLNASLVHPREVMKAAILANGASIIVGHNHPSQDPTPSREDCEVTKRLVEAGKIIGIDVLDDLIVCEEKFVSLKEKGYICRERCLELPEICRDLQSKRVFVNSTKNKVPGTIQIIGKRHLTEKLRVEIYGAFLYSVLYF